MNARRARGNCPAPTCSSMPIDTKASYSPVHVPIVVLDELDAIVQTVALRPVAGVRDLLVRDVERPHPHAVVPRHEQREAAPAAARFDDAFAGLQPQLAAHVVHLGLLRLLERHPGLGEVGAGVLQRFAVEPDRVKIVAEIVMPVDVVGRGRQRRIRRQVGPRRDQTESLAERPCPRSHRDTLEESQQVAANFEAARAIEIAEMQVRIARPASTRPCGRESVAADRTPRAASRRVHPRGRP